MKIKTRFDVGDIVMLTKYEDPYMIDKVTITHSNVAGKKLEYFVSGLSNRYENLTVNEYEICEKLNKKAFEKEYAKMRARQIFKEEK